MKKKPDSDTGETIEHEREICPVCGSGNIARLDSGFVCNNCGSVFPAPKRVKTDIRENPRYIG